METIDIILFVIIFVFGVAGFIFGFIHTLGSLLGTVLGVYLAIRYYSVLADWLMNITGWEGNISKVVMFVVAFFLISRLVGLFFWLVNKLFKLFRFLPFVKTFDRFLGALLGLSEGVITVGMVIFFIERFPLSEKLMERLSESVIAPYTTKVASILWPLLPDAFQIMKSTVDYVENIVK
jgi:membrane protein required for colicin V production